jgi:hypothetical protein
MTISRELKQAVELAGTEPVAIEDPENHASYVVLKREVYERLLKLMEVERVDRSLYEFGEFRPVKR